MHYGIDQISPSRSPLPPAAVCCYAKYCGAPPVGTKGTEYRYKEVLAGNKFILLSLPTTLQHQPEGVVFPL